MTYCWFDYYNLSPAARLLASFLRRSATQRMRTQRRHRCSKRYSCCHRHRRQGYYGHRSYYRRGCCRFRLRGRPPARLRLRLLHLLRWCCGRLLRQHRRRRLPWFAARRSCSGGSGCCCGGGGFGVAALAPKHDAKPRCVSCQKSVGVGCVQHQRDPAEHAHTSKGKTPPPRVQNNPSYAPAMPPLCAASIKHISCRTPHAAALKARGHLPQRSRALLSK